MEVGFVAIFKVRVDYLCPKTKYCTWNFSFKIWFDLIDSNVNWFKHFIDAHSHEHELQTSNTVYNNYKRAVKKNYSLSMYTTIWHNQLRWKWNKQKIKEIRKYKSKNSQWNRNWCSHRYQKLQQKKLYRFLHCCLGNSSARVNGVEKKNKSECIPNDRIVLLYMDLPGFWLIYNALHRSKHTNKVMIFAAGCYILWILSTHESTSLMFKALKLHSSNHIFIHIIK